MGKPKAIQNPVLFMALVRTGYQSTRRGWKCRHTGQVYTSSEVFTACLGISRLPLKALDALQTRELNL